jgi:hypothetical protein
MGLNDLFTFAVGVQRFQPRFSGTWLTLGDFVYSLAGHSSFNESFRVKTSSFLTSTIQHGGFSFGYSLQEILTNEITM